MTTIASFSGVTFADSLHILKIESGDDNYIRRPKLHILNEWAAYAISGNAMFPPAIKLAIETELKRIIDIIIEKGFANASDIGMLHGLITDDAHILVILNNSRWVIQDKEIVYIPEDQDIFLGSGASHYNSLRFMRDDTAPEVLLSKLVLLDGQSRGPWIRFEHSKLKSKTIAE